MTCAATFSADWLALREPHDAAARDRAADAIGLAEALRRCRPGDGDPWRVVDLACGTGANLRWLAPRLPGAQRWVAVDHDAALLAAWPGLPRGLDAQVQPLCCDLVRAFDSLPWAGATLVTASALLDLVGAAWLDRLVQACRGAGSAALLALSVDGRHDWSPADADDGLVGAAFAAHQRRDKGFGPALGGEAGAAAAAAFGAAGYRVRTAASDWRLDARAEPAAAALLRPLIDGISDAAAQQQPSDAARIRAWQARRQAAAGATALVVGHVDLWAEPGPISG